MKLLVIHQNFPGQFRHVVLAAIDRRYEILAIGRDTAPGIAGVKIYRYRAASRAPGGIHPYLTRYEQAVTDGQKVFEILSWLKHSGYRPDVILAHPGWGETLFVKDVYPDAPLIHYCEYYYRARGADSGFDPEFPRATRESSRLRVLNSLHLLNLEQCDIAIAPTRWQRSLFPAAYQSAIRVIHEGVIQSSSLAKTGAVRLPNGVELRAGQPIVTYVARNLEPYRGFHSFMRAIPHIQAECPDAQIIIVGGDEVSYGCKPVGYANWRSKMEAEICFDDSRVHFTGKLPYRTYRAVLDCSKVHVYLTYPFVLSWSLLEAMAVGCAVIASDTAPVREVIVDGHNGLLVDFFDHHAIAKRIARVLESAGEYDRLRSAAKLTASRFNVEYGTKQYFEVFENATSGYLKKQPAPQFGREV
ncbi:glycosyltransferase family 4 protein [Pseudomonas monsensis]|uniref:Glycosyltransferase family 4 protein n=1 Tax=Pseudomonas monsensis TaxID=2745509 RepID=A0ABT3YXH9_9PSED|nr:glycosyltransferase family 4 protein [Pseudomonas monsensis]MCY0110209.1 glycosyltransferase family 4 protein [Pseudomonas monsensis]